jgi:thiamine-monophosphate kinase
VPLSTRVSHSESSPSVGDLGERRLIERIRQRFSDSQNALLVGIGDDAAVAVPARGSLEVLTTDALVESVHFDLAFSSYSDVGFKAIAVNASDIAAMGATPRLALLSLMLPERTSADDVDVLLDGFAEMASAAGITLAGGNITRSPGPLIIDVSLVGSVKPRRVLTRAGGRPGDVLYVTGTIGAAAAGLGWLRAHTGGSHPDTSEMRECVARHRRPIPRLRIGAVAGRTRAVSACMDLSDGLADAVRQVAEQSGTGARVNADALPVHPGAAAWFAGQGRDPMTVALAGGDDYELLLAVPPRSKGRLRNLTRLAQGVPITRIGELTESREISLVRDGHAEPLPSGFVHF